MTEGLKVEPVERPKIKKKAAKKGAPATLPRVEHLIDRPYSLGQCNRCGYLVLSGITGGMSFQVDIWVVPDADARVLDRYSRRMVFTPYRRRGATWYLDSAWFGGQDRTGPFLINHTCDEWWQR